MEMTDEQRKALYTQVRTLEVEFAHWCRLFASRSQERVDLLKGLRVLREERRKRLEEIETLSKDLTWLQKHVPSAAGLVQGIDAATKSALLLNTTFENIKSDAATKAKCDLRVLRCCGAFTPSTRVVFISQCRGWFLFRV